MSLAMGRYETADGLFVVEWGKQPGGYWFNIFRKAGKWIARGSSIYPPLEMDVELTLDRLGRGPAHEDWLEWINEHWRDSE